MIPTDVRGQLSSIKDKQCERLFILYQQCVCVCVCLNDPVKTGICDSFGHVFLKLNGTTKRQEERRGCLPDCVFRGFLVLM